MLCCCWLAGPDGHIVLPRRQWRQVHGVRRADPVDYGSVLADNPKGRVRVPAASA